MKPLGAKVSTYIDFDDENNDKDQIFKIHHRIIISKYKNNFAKCYITSWLDKVFVQFIKHAIR